MAKKGELTVQLALKDYASKALKVFGGKVDKTAKSVERRGGEMAGVFNMVTRSVTAISVAFLAVVKAAEVVGRAIALAFKAGFIIMRTVYRYVTNISEGLDRVAKMATRFSESARSLTEFRLIAELTGTSIETIGTAMRAGARNAVDFTRGVGEAKDEFVKLGITQEELLHRVKTGGDLIELVASRWGNLKDGIEKTNAAQKIFGRGGLDIVPILEMEAGAINDLRKLVQDLGGSFSKEALGPVEAMNDAFTTLKFSFAAVTEQLIIGVAPGVERVVSAFNKIIKTVAPFLRLAIKEVGDWFSSVADKAQEFLNRHQATLENAIGAIPGIVERGITDIKTIAMTSLEALGKLFFAAGLSIGDLLVTGMVSGFKIAVNKADKALSGLIDDLLVKIGLAKPVADEWKQKFWTDLLPTKGDFAASLTRSAERMEKAWEENKGLFEKVLGKVFGGVTGKPHDLGTMTVTGKPEVTAGPSVWDAFVAGFDSVLARFNDMALRMADVGSSLASGLTNAFDNLFFDLMENRFKNLGEVFKSFARNVVRALQQIAAQQLALQAVSGLRSIFGGVPGGGGLTHIPASPGQLSAKGNVFSGGKVVPYAQGGAFSGGKVVPYAQGGVVKFGKGGGLIGALFGGLPGLATNPDFAAAGLAAVSPLTSLMSKGQRIGAMQAAAPQLGIVPQWISSSWGKGFASGGIVTRPTVFPMADGATGLMGEAGPEAIMPLKRGAGGRLGVEASGAGGFASVFNDNKTIVTLNQVNNISMQGGGGAGPGVAAALKESERRAEAMLERKFQGSGRFRRQMARAAR